MQDIIIAGYGGFGKELAGYLESDGYNISGVLDGYLTYCNDYPLLGTIDDYNPQPNQLFIVAFGSPIKRFEATQSLLNKKANIFTFIHSSAYVSKKTNIGVGSIICPNSVINHNAMLGESCLLNVFSSIAHGASVGSYSVLSPYCSLSGNSSIGRGCFLGTRTTIFPEMSLGDYGTVNAHSFVKTNVPDKSIVSIHSVYKILNNRLAKEF